MLNDLEGMYTGLLSSKIKSHRSKILSCFLPTSEKGVWLAYFLIDSSRQISDSVLMLVINMCELVYQNRYEVMKIALQYFRAFYTTCSNTALVRVVQPATSGRIATH